jgi:hypothetical protein
MIESVSNRILETVVLRKGCLGERLCPPVVFEPCGDVLLRERPRP